VCSYAFLELRSIEEANNAMAFNGILFNDVNLKVGFRMQAFIRGYMGSVWWWFRVCAGTRSWSCAA
jgi:hypothetical protein